MRSSIGNKIKVTIFGESHGPGVGFVVDGIRSGLLIDEELIQKYLNFRRPYGKISTPRVEKDNYQILSGCFNGRTTGMPLTIFVENTNTKSKDYSKIRFYPRANHGDYTYHIKYNGFNDYRGGGHSSGRLTTALVILGSILRSDLAKKGIYIGSHIKQIYNIKDHSFNQDNLDEEVKLVNSKLFSVLSDEVEVKMKKAIESAANDNDSLGGIIETAITNLPVGIGDPMFHSLESQISHYIFSVGAIKGIEFGLGFDFVNHRGSEVMDEFVVENSKVKTLQNNNAGINAGISNGMPVIFRSVVKPTPSIFKEQKSIDMNNLENVLYTINGRHDPCIVHRVRVVIDSVVAICIYDILLATYGDNYFDE